MIRLFLTLVKFLISVYPIILCGFMSIVFVVGRAIFRAWFILIGILLVILIAVWIVNVWKILCGNMRVWFFLILKVGCWFYFLIMGDFGMFVDLVIFFEGVMKNVRKKTEIFVDILEWVFIMTLKLYFIWLYLSVIHYIFDILMEAL